MKSKNEKIKQLAGMTYVLQDSFMKKGEIFTAGLKMLDGFHSPITATSVQRLDDAGATCKGYTDPATFTPNATTFALTTDSDGSIAKLASSSNFIAIRPTYGAISRFGVSSTVSSTDAICYLAPNLDNAKLVLSILSGKDPLDSTTIAENIYDSTPKTIKTIGIIKNLPIDTNLDLETETIETPHLKHSLAAYRIIMSAEIMSNFMRFDGIRYGASVRTDNGSLTELYGKSRAAGLPKDIQQNILLGNYVLENANFEKYYVKAEKIRTLIIQDFLKAFEQVDAIALPSTSDEAIAAVALAGFPMISLPSGISLIGRRQEDVALLDLAQKLTTKGAK